MTLVEASGAPPSHGTEAGRALASVSRLPTDPTPAEPTPVEPAPPNHGGYRLQPDYYEPARVPAEVLRHSGRPATLRVGSPGKVGVLQLEFQLHGGTTQLTHHYQKSPLQIMRPLYFDPVRPDMPYVFLTSTGGGILQGDRLRTDLTFGPDSATHVTSQAHSKVYKMDRDYATSLMNLTVAEGAYVEYLPDPVILFERSRLYQRTAVVLDESATLVLGETVYAGRLARGERHEYDVYASDLEVRRPDGHMVALDRVRLCPAEGGVGGMGVLAGHDVLSMIYVFVPPDAGSAQALADTVHDALTHLAEDDLVFGVSVLPADAGICLRLVGDDTVVATRAAALVVAVLHELLTGNPAPPIRKC